MKWSEVKWREVKWSEVKWRSEVKKWSEEVKWSEAGTKTWRHLWIFGILKCILSWWSSVFMHVWNLVVLGKLKKKEHLDGLSPTYLKPPPPTPLKMDYVFFSHHCFIVLFQFLDIIFTLKVKKQTWKVDSARDPPPHCGLSPSKCFFVFF